MVQSVVQDLPEPGFHQHEQVLQVGGEAQVHCIIYHGDNTGNKKYFLFFEMQFFLFNTTFLAWTLLHLI